MLSDPDEDVRRTAFSAVARSMDELGRTLLSKDNDGSEPYLDPRQPITNARIQKAAKKLKRPTADIRARYEALAAEFGLTVEPAA